MFRNQKVKIFSLENDGNEMEITKTPTYGHKYIYITTQAHNKIKSHWDKMCEVGQIRLSKKLEENKKENTLNHRRYIKTM